VESLHTIREACPCIIIHVTFHPEIRKAKEVKIRPVANEKGT